VAQDLRGDLELLGRDGCDAGLGSKTDGRAFLGAEDAELCRPRQKRVQIGFSMLTPSASGWSPLSILRNGTTPLSSQR
jgi:hypothetical protein